MALTDIGELPPRGRVLVDSAPIIYFLEGHRELAPIRPGRTTGGVRRSRDVLCPWKIGAAGLKDDTRGMR